jgi:hypothetical protein
MDDSREDSFVKIPLAHLERCVREAGSVHFSYFGQRVYRVEVLGVVVSLKQVLFVDNPRVVLIGE